MGTGAAIDGPCPGCNRRIIGMMPQRCFYCGYDFTDAIKAQNPNFKPDVGYKSPIADAQPAVEAAAMEEAEHALDAKLNDRYGQPAGFDVESTAEEIKDPFEVMAEGILEDMDRQRLVQDAAEKMLDQVASSANAIPKVGGIDQTIKNAIREIIPAMTVNEVKVEEWWDPETQSKWRRYVIDVDMTSERIVGIRLDKKYKIDGTQITN